MTSYIVLTLVNHRAERLIPSTRQQNRVVGETRHAERDIDISLGGWESARWSPVLELVKCAAGCSWSGRGEPAVFVMSVGHAGVML